jgi:STE24 endopeptidase
MPEGRDASRYHALQFWLGLASFAVTLGVLVWLTLSGIAAQIALIVAVLTDSWWAEVVAVAVAVGLGQALLTLPVRWLRGFWLPRRYGLLHQPLSAWLGDRAKAAGISGVLGFGAVLVVYGLLRVTGWWWLITAAVFFTVGVGLAALFPVLILPLFYRLTPLADPVLEGRLLALARQAGVPVVGVWVVDQSRKSRTANAAVVGLGRTRRIVLFDTLATGFREEEVAAVLAHELGHHVHRDLRRGLVVQAALMLLAFWLASLLVRAGVSLWNLEGPADPAGMPWLALVLTVLAALQVPLTNGFSRWIERQADDYALTLTRDPAGFIGAMERLAELNLAERRPNRLKEILLYSHPALDRRIARARGGVA